MSADTPALPAALDLAALRRADALVAETGLRLRAEPILARLAPTLDSLDPALQALGRHLAEEIARIGLAQETLRQEVAATRRSREDWVKLDPLSYIPGSRRAEAPPLPDSVVMTPRAENFAGAGWHGPESDGQREWRWSGHSGDCATLLLPGLGAGRLRLTLHMIMPFGARWNTERSTLVINATPVALKPISPPDSGQPVLQAEFDLVEDAALGPISLVLVMPRYTAPTGGDTRALGPGFMRVEIARAD
ncbi:hypothetical protein [Roseomonas sp. 18066]|uniref:hypothetical protein n=1 Tax=Roseomonas sp. 18066 TaxID=2681412 RepID=UPI0013568788|nr:hypothetical protein [Roseomonas sp. 18066]